MAEVLGGGRASVVVRTSWQVSVAVWSALFLREASARLFAGRAAWVWLFVEPIIHATFLLLLFSTVRDRSVEGVDQYAPFLILGILGFNVFKYPAQRCLAAVDSSRALFGYRQVKPVDTVLVRGFLEGSIQAAVTIVLLIGMDLAGYSMMPHDPLLLTVTFLLLWVLGTGFGMVLSTGTLLAPEFGRFAAMIFMPLYFASGIFFRPEIAPPAIREWLLLNPLLHGVELLRAAMFPRYHMVPEISFAYVAEWALALTFLGLALQVRYARRLAAQ